MNRSLAAASALSLALAAGMTVTPRLASAQAQPPPGSQCNDFVKLRTDAQQKANLVKVASQNKQDRKGMCAAVERFAAAEGLATKFLENNMTWCGIPKEVVADAKANHEKTLKFRTMVCSEGPPAAKPRAPTLSDAIATPSVDTGGNTKTGEGTFDTLTGNPLKR
jgi:hypothetical protein